MSLPDPYYCRDGITLYLARCEDVLPMLPAGVFDLVFTSPPYNLGVSSGGGFSGIDGYIRGIGRGVKGKWTGGDLANGYGQHDDAMPYSKYVDWQRGVLSACWMLLNDRGAIFYNHKPRVQGGELQTPLMLNPGLPLRQIIIWARNGGINFATTHYVPAHEWILVLAKADFRLANKGESGLTDVWYVSHDRNNAHPAPFPVALPTRALESTGAQIVCDPFAGSGSTLLAAKLLGRQAVGIEREERFCEMAVRRLSQEVMAL